MRPGEGVASARGVPTQAGRSKKPTLDEGMRSSDEITVVRRRDEWMRG